MIIDLIREYITVKKAQMIDIYPQPLPLTSLFHRQYTQLCHDYTNL